MKKILLYSAILSLCILSACNEKKISASEVPQPAVTAFTTKYPGATDVEWKTEKKNDKTVYEAEFKLNSKKKEAEFDANGNFIEEE
jgi:uncharacterized membrane protein YkoI